ncbi:conserved repeat domain-containing protein [Rhodospirillales bacterium URHD0017]|nr:conserved repeat domain-containing protein [Rhodospirillales bacterium URHD0017]
MRSALLAGLALATSATTALAQLPDPRPDLAIAGIVNSGVRVGIGETFFYAVTARNAGSTPCNWVNLTLKLPGEVDLVSATSGAPLICGQDAAIRIVGLPFDVACRGGPGFFLMPGSTVTATFTVRALRAAPSVTATAVADPGNVCFEANEANNTATSTATALILRPRLQVTQNKPFAPSIPAPPGRGPGSQIFPVTITNLGPGPAINVALAVTQGYIVSGSSYTGPEIAVAYKGQRAAEGQTPSNQIPPDCSTTRRTDLNIITRSCLMLLVLQPGEMLQVHYRWFPCPNPGGTPVLPPAIHIGTADELAGSDHVVNLLLACTF